MGEGEGRVRENLGHHFVSGLKYFLFHKQKGFWRRMLSRTEK